MVIDWCSKYKNRAAFIFEELPGDDQVNATTGISGKGYSTEIILNAVLRFS